MRITIPSPCSQDFSSMPRTQKGYFCKHCSKEVVDYRNYSKEELVKALMRERKPCGILREDQLDKGIAKEKKNVFSILSRTVFASYLLSRLSTAEAAPAEDIQKPVITFSDHGTYRNNELPGDSLPSLTDSITISLTFHHDSVKIERAGLTVTLILTDNNTRLYQHTDSTGAVKFTLPFTPIDTLTADLIKEDTIYRASFIFEKNRKNYSLRITPMETLTIYGKTGGGVVVRTTGLRYWWHKLRYLFYK